MTGTDNWNWAGRYLEGVDLADQVPMSNGRLTTVPREIAELAHRGYARHHRQEFDRVVERGGFGSSEIIVHLASELRDARERNDLLERVVRGLIDAMVNAGIDTREGRAAARIRTARELIRDGD